MFQKIKSFAKNVVETVGRKYKEVTVALGLGAMSALQAAHAELPPAVATTVAEIKANGESIFDEVFPVVAFFVGLGIIIKLFKRYTNKA